MSIKEMNARLAQMTVAQVERVIQLVKEGFGAQGIKFETGLPIRLINAVFHLHRHGA